MSRLIVITTLLLGCAAGPIDVAGLDPTALRMGVVALWPLDDGAGTVAADRSVNAHHGTVSGATWIAGRFGGALHFEAGNEVTVPSFPNATPDWSVSLWVRPPAGDFGDDYVTLITTENVFAGGWEMNAKLTPADAHYQFGFYLGPGDSDYQSFDCRCVVAQQWTHIVGIVDSVARVLSFYRNGILQGTTAIVQPIKPGSATLYMGRWQLPDRLLTGDLDDIVIYNRVLSVLEIRALAQSAAPSPR